MSKNNMRGLTMFIADIRNCRVRELEEKRINKEMANIRGKFKDGNLNGYQKKKYVCKLLYMYILGWEIDFGHLEAVNLISSSKYSEKQIGYLAVTLLFHENSDLVRLVVNSIKKDLDDYNEICNCLALHAIANIGGREMAESLAVDVHRLLISPNSKSFVKKKAALTLLRLYRKHPDVIPATDWADRIVWLMDDYDLGVALAVDSLVLALAQNHPDEYAGCVAKAIVRLKKILMDKDFSADYVYYKVPVPWLQVKILRLLQYYPPTEDAALRSDLNNCLQIIINNSQDTPKNVQHNNAQNAVLFEAINLAIHLDSNSQLCSQAAILLGRFLQSKETNVRYLALETMAHLAACADSLDPIKKHQETIILSLRDKDISVRRRALDLLYSMCDITNSKVIVSELLRYLQIADYAMREELVLKIAILTEKFATEYSWYVDIILQLISSAGDQVGEEVWFRVAQIVTNNEDLQEYAAKTVLNYLRVAHFNETMLKVGGYLLGEFGHLVANQPGCSPIEQFHLIHSKFNLCTLGTRAQLLTTYLKFVNLFPEIKSEILTVLHQYRHVLDAELQQRACEYLTVATMPTDDLLQTVCEEMPPFPERESALLARLNRKHGDTEDKRTWIIGGKEANREREEQLRQLQAQRRQSSLDAITGSSQPGINGANANGTGGEGDLLGLGSLTLSGEEQGSDELAHRLEYAAEGVLHEDHQLQVGLKSEYHGNLGRIAIFVGNKSQQQYTSLAINVVDPAPVGVSVAQPAPATVGPLSQSQQLFHLECNSLFRDMPSILLKYTTINGVRTLQLKLPVLLTKFVEPIQLDATNFFSRWKQIGGAPREKQVVLACQHPIQVAFVRKMLEGYRFGVLEGVDPNADNVVCAGVVHAGSSGKVGVLVRVEPNLAQSMFRLTVRATSEDVADIICGVLQRALTHEHD
ncbi:uncharacterized protein VTP21DRAFT_7897 [Calcarisporiella thermophila]|uniref:uncharacterized protein n=1 Tax=Calcarisporiella thermophila TaxID=911321 RepID=UPI003741E97A